MDNKINPPFKIYSPKIEYRHVDLERCKIVTPSTKINK